MQTAISFNRTINSARDSTFARARERLIVPAQNFPYFRNVPIVDVAPAGPSFVYFSFCVLFFSLFIVSSEPPPGDYTAPCWPSYEDRAFDHEVISRSWCMFTRADLPSLVCPLELLSSCTIQVPGFSHRPLAARVSKAFCARESSFPRNLPPR